MGRRTRFQGGYMRMEVEVKEIAGLEWALEGLSYNKNQPLDKMAEVAARLAHCDGGHNKFLESIQIWVAVKAPRKFWQQADTYRMSSKQSQSTMHTIMKQEITKEDFVEDNIPDAYIEYLNLLIRQKKFDDLKDCLPEGFLQQRMWNFSLKTFRNMYLQRKTHKLKEWQYFLGKVINAFDNAIYLKALETR